LSWISLTRKPQNRTKIPERVNIGAVELLFNSWILSGLQDEELWEIFRETIIYSLDKN